MCGNAEVEIKHRKLCDKLDTDTPSYVNIRTQVRPCKSKWYTDLSF